MVSRLVTRAGLSALFAARALFSPVVLGVCAFAQNRDGRVLLVRHSYQNGWLFPGGGVARGEPPELAIVRELQEEVGYIRSRQPEFFRLYTRKVGWASNVVALYRFRDIEIEFRRNLEIREAIFVSPDALPEGTPATVRRRVDEVLGNAIPSAYW